jgi:endonuclease III
VAAPSLVEVVATLKGRLKVAPVPTDPFEMILWENIGYLVDDERRRALFDAFAAAVGLDARAIDEADDAVLLPLARKGGMRPETRVQRWRAIARLIAERCGADLDGTLRALPVAKARALLKLFPVIGDPGADKILLLSGVAPRPALESNGLRALARLGFFKEQGSYAASYKAGIEVLVAQGRPDGAWLADAHLLLRELGKLICKRGVPLCMACPLEPVCPKLAVDAL